MSNENSGAFSAELKQFVPSFARIHSNLSWHKKCGQAQLTTPQIWADCGTQHCRLWPSTLQFVALNIADCGTQHCKLCYSTLQIADCGTQHCRLWIVDWTTRLIYLYRAITSGLHISTSPYLHISISA